MNIKFDFPKIESYSLVLSEKLCSEFYQKNNIITGKQLLEFCPIEQVNFFVLMNLLDKWKEESEKVKSPYFDYDSAEVKASFKEFMNVLSQNIAIRREFFKPLLQKAIADTLVYALDPVYYIKTVINSANDGVFRSSVLKDKVKYIRLNKSFYQAVVKETEGLNEMSIETVVPRIEHFAGLNQHVVENNTVVIDKFSALFPLRVEYLTVQPVVEKAEAPAPEPKPSVSFFEALNDEEEEKPVIIITEPKAETITKPEPVRTELPKVAETIKQEPVKVAEAAMPELPKVVEAVKPEPVKAETEVYTEQEKKAFVQSQSAERNTYNPSVATLNSSFENKQKTLNELLKPCEKPTIAEQLAKSKIVNIKSAISLNQKFIFINTLFMGEAKEFDTALSEVDACLTLGAAKEILEKKYISKFKWDMNAAEAREFMEIVSRKFS